MAVLLVLFCVLALQRGHAHSWASCVKYNKATSTCEGYARNWFKQPSEPFFRDQGWDRRPGRSVANGGLFCDNTKQQAHAQVSDGYSAKFPMASYAPGETITVQWPAKNHATVHPGGIDRGVQLFFGKGPGLGDDFSHITSKAAWLAKYPTLTSPYDGPNVCTPNRGGVDSAECLGEFTVPTDLAAGVYSVIWWWEFNAGEFYSSCYDVLVTADGGGNGGGGGGGGGGDGAAPPGTGDDDDECNEANLPADVCRDAALAAPGADGLALVNPPSAIPRAEGSAFSLSVKYDASEPMRVVVDVLDASGNFYGGGLGSAMTVQPGAGTLSYPVELTTALPAGPAAGLYLKVWNVRTSDFSADAADQPWKNEITRRDQPVTAADALKQCTPLPAECQGRYDGSGTSGGGGGGGGSGGLVAGLVVTFVLLFAAAGAAAFVLLRRRRRAERSRGDVYVDMEAGGIGLPARTKTVPLMTTTGGGGGGGKFVPRKNMKVRAKHAYRATQEDELSFGRGAVLRVLAVQGDGWCRGRDVNTRKEGLFPGNFVGPC